MAAGCIWLAGRVYGYSEILMSMPPKEDYGQESLLLRGIGVKVRG